MNRIRQFRWVLWLVCPTGIGCAVSSGADSGEGGAWTGVATQTLRGGHSGPHLLRHVSPGHHHHRGHRPHHCRHHPPAGNESISIVPDESGFIDPTSNSLGIGGPWYWFADGYGNEGARDGSCQAAGHDDSECSLFTSPDPSLPGFPNLDGVMCASGTVARVLVGDSGDYDWANMGFAGIGFNLNQTEAEPGVLDAEALHVIGFAFEIDDVPSAFRVQVSTPDSPTSYYAYWGAADYFPDSPVVEGRNVVLFSEVQSPEAEPQPVDITQLEGIQFVIPGNPDQSVPFSFCISNVEMLVEG